MNLEMHPMDVKMSFLNGELEEDIYLDQPKDFVEEGKPHLVCKLNKSLYGLKESLRAWYQWIDTFFINKRFVKSKVDYLIYVMQSKELLLILILYVDNLIILINTLKTMDYLKAKLEKKYKMSNLEELHYCLGVEFLRDCTKKTIIMSQKNYIEEVLKRFNMEDCKSIGIPLEAKL